MYDVNDMVQSVPFRFFCWLFPNCRSWNQWNIDGNIWRKNTLGLGWFRFGLWYCNRFCLPGFLLLSWLLFSWILMKANTLLRINIFYLMFSSLIFCFIWFVVERTHLIGIVGIGTGPNHASFPLPIHVNIEIQTKNLLFHSTLCE